MCGQLSLTSSCTQEHGISSPASFQQLKKDTCATGYCYSSSIATAVSTTITTTDDDDDDNNNN